MSWKTGYFLRLAIDGHLQDPGEIAVVYNTDIHNCYGLQQYSTFKIAFDFSTFECYVLKLLSVVIKHNVVAPTSL